MRDCQFRKAEQAIILSTGTKSTTPAPPVSWGWDCQTQRPIMKVEISQWTKSATPHRLSLKNCVYIKPKFRKKRRMSKRRHTSVRDLDTECTSVTGTTRPMSSSTPCDPDVSGTAPASRTAGGEYELPCAPLTTLVVKWQLNFNYAPYSISELGSTHADMGQHPRRLGKKIPYFRRHVATPRMTTLRYLLSRFGRVLYLCKVQTNSALVVYGDLVSAQRAVKCTNLGSPLCRLTCQWFYPTVQQPNIFAALKDHRFKEF